MIPIYSQSKTKQQQQQQQQQQQKTEPSTALYAPKFIIVILHINFCANSSTRNLGQPIPKILEKV